MRTVLSPSERRARRTRIKLRKAARGRPRLSVFRSIRHIHAQIIDDEKGHTLAAASSLDKEARGGAKAAPTEAARQTGVRLAQRAKKIGVEKVVFDRGGCLYHGRVRALAEAAREGGLQF